MATVGQVGRGWLAPCNIRVHYNCRSRRAEPILGANAPASATAPYCWKHSNREEVRHESLACIVDQVDFVRFVCPCIP